MQISKYFKPEALMFAAFLATLPIYSPNQLLFETELLQRAAYMPAFANTLLGASVVLGVAVAIVSARGRLAVILRGGVVLAASVAYVAGYALFALAAGLESFAQPIFGVTVGLLLAVSTVVLSVAWGAYLAQFNLRQALLWLAVMVGVAALVELLLSSVTFAVGLIVFAVLVPLSCLVPCWLAWRGRLIAVREAGEAESRSAPTLGAMAQLRQMAQVVAMPFVGLMVFAFMMGARKFVLFDVVHMEVLGCVLGAVVVLPICLMRTRVPLMPLIYRVLVPLFALLLIFLNCFPASTGPMWFAAWMSYAFYGAVAILALAGLVAVAHASEFSPGLIFGTTVAGFSGCSLLGVIAAQTVLFQIEGGGPALLVVSTLYFVYLLASALLAPWKRDRGDIVLEEGADAAKAVPVRDVAARCEELARACGLTPREGEILGYLGRGHGIAFVADALVISESTVRTHVKSIYKKLGVNSREELVSKVSEE